MSFTAGELRTFPLLTTAGDSRLSATSTGQKARMYFGVGNHIIREVGFVPTTTAAIPVAAVWSVRVGDVGVATATTQHQAAITMVTGASQAKPISRRNLNIAVTATQEANFAVTTLASSLTVRGYVIVEPDWEVHENQSNVTTVTA
jgi:hypothetical protein